MPHDNNSSPTSHEAGNGSASLGASVPNHFPTYLDAAMGNKDSRAPTMRANHIYPTPAAAAAVPDHLDGFPLLGAPPRGGLLNTHRGGHLGFPPPSGARAPARHPRATKIFTPAAAAAAAHHPALGHPAPAPHAPATTPVFAPHVFAPHEPHHPQHPQLQLHPTHQSTLPSFSAPVPHPARPHDPPLADPSPRAPHAPDLPPATDAPPHAARDHPAAPAPHRPWPSPILVSD